MNEPDLSKSTRVAPGSAFLEALARDIRYAIRTFRRAPLAALTIVATVALGLGLVTVVFTFYNAVFLRVDAVRNPGELFEVRRPPSPERRGCGWRSRGRITRRCAAIPASLPMPFAMLPGIATRVDGRAMSWHARHRQLLSGAGCERGARTHVDAGDDERFAGRPVIVLSHRGWTRLFAEDPAAIGRSLLVNGAPYEIIGVMPPGFRGLAISPPDYWAPLDLLGQFRPALAGTENEVAIEVVGRLKPGLSPEAATAGLTVWASGNPDMRAVNGRPKTILLRPKQGTAPIDVARRAA